MTIPLLRSLVVLGILSVATSALAADKTIDLGAGRAVIFDLTATLKMQTAENPEGIDGKTIKIVARNGSNAECNVTVLVDSEKRFADRDMLKDLLTLSASSMVDQSVEGKVVAREFKTPHGSGFSATFTDKNLVGQPGVAGDYKSATFVILSLPDQIGVIATILADDPQGPEFKAMMALLRSLGVRTASSVI
ncbi:MAG TPA: hypothetical protein VGM73_13110 [Candidatus Didemnitutus sp.]|jgi:hypothetical protein